MLFDKQFTLDDHAHSLLKCSQLRQGIRSRVARATWGLHTTEIRITHDATVSSLLRYGPTLTGSCVPNDVMNKVDTQIFNIASRRIVGLPLSVRVASLHFISATHSLRNLYIRQCAMFVHLTLVSHKSHIRQRIIRKVSAIFQAPALYPKPRELVVDLTAASAWNASEPVP